MPVYFAYGSNMDEHALHTRCPKARLLGRAQLARHRFVLMGNGWASVHRDPRASVHGVLFDLALSDIPALDRYEDVAHNLYVKATQPVLREGRASCHALIYIGTDTTTGGTPIPGYVEAIVAAAKTAGLPGAYVAFLETFISAPAGVFGRRRIS